MKYFKHAKKQRKVNDNKEVMKGIYGGFETWLNKYGKEITLAKNYNKTLHSVMARWTSKDRHKSGKSAELESNESKDKEEDKGY